MRISHGMGFNSWPLERGSETHRRCPGSKSHQASAGKQTIPEQIVGSKSCGTQWAGQKRYIFAERPIHSISFNTCRLLIQTNFELAQLWLFASPKKFQPTCPCFLKCQLWLRFAMYKSFLPAQVDMSCPTKRLESQQELQQVAIHKSKQLC